MWRWFNSGLGGRLWRARLALPQVAAQFPRAEPAAAVLVPAPQRRSEAIAPQAPEQRRLARLQARGEEAYPYIVDMAARICQTPVAAIVLVDGDMLRFKACVGIATDRMPVAGSPCQLTLEHGAGITVVSEVASDPRFSGSAMARFEPPLQCYAGAPVASRHGVVVGALWVADHRPRNLSPVPLGTLELLARQTGQLLDVQHVPP